jgi:hypothetical protein
MPPISKSQVDSKELQKLYSGGEAARAVLDHFANRERNQRTSLVRRIRRNVTNDGHSTSRGETIWVLKQLEALHCGDFKAGRKGHESRFEWQVSSKSVGQVAAGEAAEVEEEVPPTDEAAEETDDLLEHRFQLRPDVTVTINLPSDFSTYEAKRLSAFIDSLPFSTSA